MRARTVLAFLFLALACAPIARAQAPCSIHTITGTYAVQITGQSLIGSLVPSGAPYQLAGGEAVFVAKLTVSPDGSVQGPLWGVYVDFPVEADFVGQATVNPDCTGELVADESFKFVVLDNGKEIRWVPWDGFGGSVGTWHRITRADDPAPRCGQHTLSGNYVMRCEGFEFTGVDSGVASAWSLFVLSAGNGAISGKVYGKRFGIPSSTKTESAVTGTYAVHDDCTFDTDLSLVDAMPPGLSYRARGIVFDQGKEVIGLPLGIYAGDTPVAPVLPLTCVMTRMGR
jgi:hypothetical protein